MPTASLHSMCRALQLGLLLACLPRLATAAKPNHPWKVDDIIQLETIPDFQISPDGARVVWVKMSTHPDKDEFLTQLHLTDIPSGREVQLTRGKVSASNPRWSPDSRRLAFMTSRADPDRSEKEPVDEATDDAQQIWILDLFGGEPFPVTAMKRGIRQFEWRDPETVVFSAQEDPTWRDADLKEKKDRSVVTEDDTHEPPVRLFEVGLADKKVRRLSDNLDRISRFAISHDGKRVLALHDRSLRFEYDQRIRPTLWLHDLTQGTRRQWLGDSPPMIIGMTWARNDRNAYLVVARATHPVYVHAVVLEPQVLDVVTGELTPLPPQGDRGLTEDGLVAATPDGFLALGADGVRVKLLRWTRDGVTWRSRPMGGDHVTHLQGFSLSAASGMIAYLHSRADRTPQLVTAKVGADGLTEAKPLTHLNESVTAKAVGDVETVHWAGANQVEIEGLLFKPPGFKPDQKYPLVLMIHGGPFGADKDLWSHNWAYAPALYTQRGALVLQPNYQGSSSYGLAFAEAIANGKYYDLPVEDILKGVDHLMAKGSVDTNKIGSIGWSNGAILTMALVTQDSRFKAASAGAGGVEWTADTATCAFGLSFNDYYFGATPWADPERYRKVSPFWHMDRITTPILLFQGSDDTAVPPHHAWMQLRLLQEYQKAPVRLVQLPGEPHSLKRPSSQRRKLQEELAWFDRHLFAATPEVSTVLKENSPLARTLELRKAARVGNRYGRSVMGKLVPEAVPYREVMVGRFEITRAQFAEFEPTYRVAVGQENHPAAGVSFSTAQAYAEWLSRLTGETWRLPRPDEAKNLYESSDSDSNPNENTLDHWTGYTANPEDTSRVLVEIQKLGGPTELLREVGSFPGRRDGDGPSVFDLGGNVAEWVTRVDGSGEPRGGRADWPSDAKTTQRDASPACVGFRVIRANPSTPRN